ncbi:TRML4 protein, partial [Pomatostomus ruficeps]|nr:TRML4 protein [Pomatostomus ruficeps]
IILLFLLLLSRTCNRLQGQTPQAERRREGGTLYVRCPYKPQTNDGQLKFWCRLLKDQRCQDLAWTHYDHKAQFSDKKLTMEGDTTSGTVSITMTDLKAEDSGTYSCAYKEYGGRCLSLRTISLVVFKGWVLAALSVPGGRGSTVVTPSLSCSSHGDTFIILSGVLLVLLILALILSVTLAVRHSRLLGRAGNRGAEDSGDRAEGTAQPGSTGRRESSPGDSKGPGFVNLDVQSHPSPEDPLYCNVEPSQAHRTPQSVEYAIIAFNQSPRSDRE